MTALMAFENVAWLPEGQRFAPDDLLFYAAKSSRPLAEVAAHFDLILTGPHAEAAFPAETRPFLDESLTGRIQHDFSDVATDAVGRRWAAIDGRVLYIRNPHPRLVRDANRPMPNDSAADIAEFFQRMQHRAEGGKAAFSGIDAIRAATFALLPVLRRDADLAALTCCFAETAARGVGVYETTRDRSIEMVWEAKCRALAALDPDRVSVTDFHSACLLHIQSLHDSMDATARPDGAVANRRAAADRLPALVTLSNRGDQRGDARIGAGPLAAADALSMPGPALRSLANAVCQAFDAPADAVWLNHPYLGGHEVQMFARRLADRNRRAGIARDGLPPLRLVSHAYQTEFLREYLLGPAAAAHIATPGTDWPATPEAHVDGIAQALKRAYTALRRAGAEGVPGPF
jgi:hypothetical protein